MSPVERVTDLHYVSNRTMLRNDLSLIGILALAFSMYKPPHRETGQGPGMVLRKQRRSGYKSGRLPVHQTVLIWIISFYPYSY